MSMLIGDRPPRDCSTTAFGDHDVPGTLPGITVLGYSRQLAEIGAMAAAAR